mgnify:CR=1 FL=1
MRYNLVIGCCARCILGNSGIDDLYGEPDFPELRFSGILINV